jgi:hypothetical protein
VSTDSDLDSTEFDKILGQYRLRLNGLLKPLRLYGQGVVVDAVADELVHLALQMHMKLSGVDMPYEVNDMSWWEV